MQLIHKSSRVHHLEHTDITYNDPFIDSSKNNNNIDIFNNGTKIGLINEWLILPEYQKDTYYKLLYERRTDVRHVKAKAFNAHVTSFIHQKKLNSSEGWNGPNSRIIFSNVKQRIILSNDHTLTDSDRKEAMSIQDVIEFNIRKGVKSRNTAITTNGWFKIPENKLKRVLQHKTITTGDYHYLESQNKQFDNIKLLLSNYTDSKKYFKTLPDEIDSITVKSSTNSEITQLDKFIANEILLDLRELVDSYKSLINIQRIDVRRLEDSLETRHIFPLYIEYFKRSNVVKTVFDSPRVFGSFENDIFKLIRKFSTHKLVYKY